MKACPSCGAEGVAPPAPCPQCGTKALPELELELRARRVGQACEEGA